MVFVNCVKRTIGYEPNSLEKRRGSEYGSSLQWGILRLYQHVHDLAREATPLEIDITTLLGVRIGYKEAQNSFCQHRFFVSACMVI